MTLDEAMPQLVCLVPGWTDGDVRSFVAASAEEQLLIIQSLKDSRKVPSRSAWEVFLFVLTGCVEVANVILPLTGAVQAVFGLAKA